MRYPTTVKTLIDKLRDGDSVSWGEFYEPVSPDHP